MEKLEEEYVREICSHCCNNNIDDCSIRVFSCNNHICCKCVNYKGKLNKTEVSKVIKSGKER